MLNKALMPRRKLIRQNAFPYHVTTRTNNKDWFRIPLCDVWDICKEALIYSQRKRRVLVHCFVLMGNHYHLLVTTPDSNIDEFMRFFNLKLSQLISKEAGVINHKFSNRYKWTIVDNQRYLKHVYRYIYQNPVRANLVIDPMDYPYSSLHFSRFESKFLNHKPHFRYHKDKAWFEERLSNEFNKILRLGLTHKSFTPPKRISTFNQKLLNS